MPSNTKSPPTRVEYRRLGKGRCRWQARGIDPRCFGFSRACHGRRDTGHSPIVLYAGSAPGQVAGLMQVNVQIPIGVQPGGYVPVAVEVGSASTAPSAVWIGVSER